MMTLEPRAGAVLAIVNACGQAARSGLDQHDEATGKMIWETCLRAMVIVGITEEEIDSAMLLIETETIWGASGRA